MDQNFLSKMNKLITEGSEHSFAFEKAFLERRISQWPTNWGNNLVINIFGDFLPPEIDLSFDSFGITIHKEKQENVVASNNALCVLKATVAISEKTVESLIEASSRINKLIGIMALVNLWNGEIGWWSWVTHGAKGGSIQTFNFDQIDLILTSFQKLPVAVKNKVSSALYWMREPKTGIAQFHKRNILGLYSGYWNAFECLVDAVELLCPQAKLTKLEKQKSINDFIKSKSGKLNSEDISSLYINIVNPGLFVKATHSLQVCFQDKAEYYINECFKRKDKHNRLYDIRNSINHGDFQAENLTELLRVESRIDKLSLILREMFIYIFAFNNIRTNTNK